jgi:hypothetical protein
VSRDYEHASDSPLDGFRKAAPRRGGWDLPEAIFPSIGAIAEKDPNVLALNRDPEAFFRATYLTGDLRKLLEQVLTSLCGESGYNRVSSCGRRFVAASRTPLALPRELWAAGPWQGRRAKDYDGASEAPSHCSNFSG